MKTVLKQTKRFAAVFLAFAMVVLGLPNTAMPVLAAAGDNILPESIAATGNLTFSLSTRSLGAVDATSTLTATADAGYKIPATLTGWTATLTPAAGGTAVATVGDFTRVGDATATSTITATAVGADSEAPMTFAWTGSPAAEEVSQTVTLTSIGSDTVAYSTDGGTNWSDAPVTFTASGAASFTDNELLIAITAPAGKVFHGDVTLAVSSDSESTADNKVVAGDITQPSSTTGSNVAIFSIANTHLVAGKLTGNSDRTIELAATGATTYDDAYSVSEYDGDGNEYAAAADFSVVSSWVAHTDTQDVTSVLAGDDLSFYVVPSDDAYTAGKSITEVQFYTASLAELVVPQTSTVDGHTLYTIPGSYIDGDVTIYAKMAEAGKVTVTPALDIISVVAGTTLENKSYTAAIAGDTGSHTVTWSLKKNDTDSYVGATAVELVNGIPGVTVTTNGNTATLTGAPTTVAAVKYYYLVATYNGKEGYAKIPVTVTDASGTLKPVDDKGNVTLNPTLSFGSKKAGYGALTAQKIRVKNVGNGSIKVKKIYGDTENTSAYTITGLAAGDTIAKGATVEITIVPKSGLTRGTYDQPIKIESDAFASALTIAGTQFTVTSDLAVSVNGKEAEIVLSGLDTKDFDLGTYEVGDLISGITISATETGKGLAFNNGDKGTPTTIEYQLDQNPLNKLELVTANLRKTSGTVSTTSFTLKAGTNVKGLAQGTYDSSAGTRSTATTYLAYDGTNKLTTYYIPMTLTDTETSPLNETYYGVLKVKQSDDISIVIGDAAGSGVNVKNYSTTNPYAWSGTGAQKKVVTITNGSAVDFKVSAGLAGSDYAITPTTTDATVQAGKSVSFDLTPAATADEADTITIAGGVNTVGTIGFDAVSFGANYTEVAADVPRFTTPSDATSTYVDVSNALTLPAICLGESEWSYQFAAALRDSSAGTTSTAATWTFAENTTYNDASVFNAQGTASTPIDCTGLDLYAAEMEALGLSLDPNTGALSGAITDPLAIGTDPKFAVVATFGSGAQEKSVVGFFQLDIDPAEKALSLSMDGKAISAETGIALTNTEDGADFTKTIDVTNNSFVDLDDLTFAIDNTDITTSSNIQWSKASNDDVKKNGGKNSFKIKVPAKTTAGSWTSSLTIKDKWTNVIYTLPIKLTVSKAPIVTSPAGDITQGGDSQDLKVGTKMGELTLAADEYTGGSALASSEMDWAWEAQEGSELPAGLTISGNKITGTPTKAGDFNVILKVTNTKAGSDTYGKTGTKKVTVRVTGGMEIAVTDGVSALTVTQDYPYVFNGMVKGATKMPNAFTVTVKNIGYASKDAGETGNLTIKVTDAKVDGKTVRSDGKEIPAGSADMFTLNKTTISSLAFKDSDSFTIQPKNATRAGTYEAMVTISCDKVAPQSFWVQYTVAEPLALTGTKNPLSFAVGDSVMEPLTFTGAGTPLKDDTVDENGQNVTWYLYVDGGATPSSAETSLISSLTKLGFATSASTTGTFSTSYTPNKGYEIFGGQLGEAANATVLQAASNGTALKIRAVVDEVGDPELGQLNAPEQQKTETLTLTVSATDKVFVEPEASYDAEPGTVTVAATSVSGKQKVTAINFKDIAINETAAAMNVTVKNYSAAPAIGYYDATATIVDAAGKASDAFTVTGFDTTGLTKSTGIDAFTITPKNETVKKNVTAYLLIKPTDSNPNAFEEVRIPVSVNWVDRNYAYTLYKGDSEKADDVITSFTLKDAKKGVQGDVNKFSIKNTGNVKPDGSVEIEEVANAEGSAMGSGDTRLLVVGDGTIAAGNIEPSDAHSVFTLKPSADAVSTVGKKTAYLKVTYPGEATSKVYTVEFEVLTDDGKATLDPVGTVRFDKAKENYTNVSKTFTLKNTGSAETDALKDVTVTLTGTNKTSFELSGAETSWKGDVYQLTNSSIPAGSELTFTVSPIAGLSQKDTSYTAVVTVAADNLKTPLVANIYFEVDYSDSMEVYSSKDLHVAPYAYADAASDLRGEAVTGSKAARLMQTLEDMNDAGDTHVFEVADYTGSAGEYKVNFNGIATADDYDVDVKFTTDTAVLTTGAACDIENGTATLTNKGYDAADIENVVKTVTVKLNHYVVVNVNESETSLAYVPKDDNSGWELWTAAGAFGANNNMIVYKVPFGGSIATANGDVYNGNAGYVLKTISEYAVTGMPEDLRFGSSTAVDESKELESWFDNIAKDYFDATQVVTEDHLNVTPKTHTHTYKKAAAGEAGYAVWSWASDYSKVSLSLKCDAGDHTEVLSTEDGRVALAKINAKASCTKEGGETYSASATYKGHTYTDEKVMDPIPATGHTWTYDTDKSHITWTQDASGAYTGATIKRTCSNTNHVEGDDHDGPKTMDYAAAITVVAEDADCQHAGKVTYTATWTDEATGETILTDTKVVEGVIGPHKYTKVDEWHWNLNSDATAVTSVTADVTCTVCHEKASLNAELVSSTLASGEIRYTATVSYADFTDSQSKRLKDGKLTGDAEPAPSDDDPVSIADPAKEYKAVQVNTLNLLDVNDYAVVYFIGQTTNADPSSVKLDSTSAQYYELCEISEDRAALTNGYGAVGVRLRSDKRTETDAKNALKNKKITFTVNCLNADSDSKPAEVKLTLKNSYKVPSYAAATPVAKTYADLVPEGGTASFYTYDKTGKMGLESGDWEAAYVDSKKTTVDEDVAVEAWNVNGWGELYVGIAKDKLADKSGFIRLHNENWVTGAFSYVKWTLKQQKNLTVGLSTTSIALNNNYSTTTGAQVTLGVTGVEYPFDETHTVTLDTSKLPEGLTATNEYSPYSIQVSIDADKKVAKGSYKVPVTVTGFTSKPVTKTLTIKVSDTKFDAQKASQMLKVTLKGKIDAATGLGQMFLTLNTSNFTKNYPGVGFPEGFSLGDKSGYTLSDEGILTTNDNWKYVKSGTTETLSAKVADEDGTELGTVSVSFTVKPTIGTLKASAEYRTIDTRDDNYDPEVPITTPLMVTNTYKYATSPTTTEDRVYMFDMTNEDSCKNLKVTAPSTNQVQVEYKDGIIKMLPVAAEVAKIKDGKSKTFNVKVTVEDTSTGKKVNYTEKLTVKK